MAPVLCHFPHTFTLRVQPVLDLPELLRTILLWRSLLGFYSHLDLEREDCCLLRPHRGFFQLGQCQAAKPTRRKVVLNNLGKMKKLLRQDIEEYSLRR